MRSPVLPSTVAEALAAVVAADVAGLVTVEDVEEQLRALSVVRAWADSRLTELVARADVLRAVPGGGGPGGEVLARGAARLTGREAAAVGRRTAVARHLPAFAEAFTAGRVTGEHADAVARLLTTMDPAKRSQFCACEDDLVTFAERVSPEVFAREARSLAASFDPAHTGTLLEELEAKARLRLWRGRDGLHHLSGTFGPIQGAAAVRAIEQELARLAAHEAKQPAAERSDTDRLRMVALTNLVNGGHVAEHPKPLLAVHVGIERLLGEAGAESGVCETSGGVPLPIDVVREMALRAELVPVLLNPDGTARELAPRAQRRLATFLQRVLLRAMYRTCAVPGCEVAFDDCEVHHLEPFDGSNTVLANLAPLCGADHHRHHDQGWRIALDQHRTVTVCTPDGEVWARGTFRPPGRLGDLLRTVVPTTGSPPGRAGPDEAGDPADGRDEPGTRPRAAAA